MKNITNALLYPYEYLSFTNKKQPGIKIYPAASYKF